LTLLDIFNEVAALDIKITLDAVPVTIPVLNLDDKRNKVNQSDLPVRILQWSSDQGGAGNEINYIDNAGEVISVVWQITDIMYFKATRLGFGFHEYDAKLVEYADNYVDALKLFTTCIEPRSWQLTTAAITW